jgi:hypothetical protein
LAFRSIPWLKEEAEEEVEEVEEVEEISPSLSHLTSL